MESPGCLPKALLLGSLLSKRSQLRDSVSQPSSQRGHNERAWTLLFGTVGGGAPSEVNGQLRGGIFALSPVLGFPHKPTLCQGLKCKWIFFKVVQWGGEFKKGRKPAQSMLTSRLEPWAMRAWVRLLKHRETKPLAQSRTVCKQQSRAV